MPSRLPRTAPEQNPLIPFIENYIDHPARFVEEVLGVKPDPKQAEILTAIAQGRRRISVRSGHGVGKTTTAAWAVIWWISTRYPQKTVMTAPTTAQLYDALYAEVCTWIRRLPPVVQELFTVKSENIELKADPAGSFVSARTSKAEQPEALQGIHSEHVLLIADEASGIPEPIFEAAAGSMSGEHAVTLLLGNPVRSSGTFYETHNRLSSEWTTFHLSCVDSPRVSREFIREMAVRYGEDSNAYRIRVLGEFPRADDDTLISMELVDLAVNRDVEPIKDAPVVWGLDVARFGSDKSVLLRRRANTVERIQRWSNMDLMQLTGLVVHEWESTPHPDRPVEILVDSIGIGAGVVDRLRELQLPAIGVNVSEAPSLKGESHNLRTELWTKIKAWLAARDCRLPKDEDLVAELATPRYKFTSNGKLLLESKDEMRKRGFRSPDSADALALTFAGSAAVATHGRSQANRGKPLRRKLAIY